MATYEGKWRCLRCASVNLGRNVGCATCGVKRSEDVVFFLDDDAPEVSDENFLNQANAGADWICFYCESNSRASETKCSGCGSVRTEKNKQLVEETRGIGDWSEAAQKNHKPQTPAPTQPPKPFFSRGIVKFGLLGIGAFGFIFVALFALLIFISTRTYAVEIEVTNLEWSRSIALEEYRTVTETAWEGAVPPNARVQSNERALHHTDKVPNGTRTVPETYSERVSDGTERYVCGRTNKKNGYFEDKYCTRTKYKTVTKTRNKTETIYRDVPVYKTRYTYLIDKWVAAGDKVSAGVNFDPQWADVEIDNIKLRETGRKEFYNLICKELGGDNKFHKMEVATDKWNLFQSGQRLKGTLDVFGRLISLDGFTKEVLKPEK
jgi:hypothetical protein